MLNKSQQKAEEEIHDWVLNDEPFHILQGASGHGKSYLLDHIQDRLTHYNQTRNVFGKEPFNAVHMTATTNKAAAVLKNAVTIHKLFGLRPITDYETGVTTLIKSKKTLEIPKSIIVIDESSQLDSKALELIGSLSVGSKILFVGDACQLKPVNESMSPVFDSNFSRSNLTIPQRQDPNSDLYKLCQQLRRTVETGIWEPIVEGENISFRDDSGSVATFARWFPEMSHKDASRAITYTNKKSIQFNQYVRKLCGYPIEWNVGDVVSVRNFCKDISEKEVTKIDTTTRIVDIEDKVFNEEGVDYVRCTLENIGTYRLPVCTDQYHGTIKQLTYRKRWRDMYWLKENMIDLRSTYSETSHSSQGSTYEKVFINLADLGKCTNPDTLARLLYVAVSRASKEVVFNGQLPSQFRG